MPLALVRIDDRLIHGQVAVAWGSCLGVDRIVLVNDDVAHTEWKRALYADADAMGAAISVLDIEGFAKAIEAGLWRGEKVIVVVGTARDARLLLEHGLSVASVNVGGMHHSEGKRELLPYVYVNEADRSELLAIAALGVALEARDVPGAESVDIVPLLNEPGD
jgi:PTS system mannose-specific IIB component